MTDNLSLILATGTNALPAFVVDTFPIIRIVLAIVIALMCLALTVVVLVQPSGSNKGVNPITGQSETFYGKNKSNTLEGLFRKLTVIIAITVAVLAVVYFATVIIYPGV